jgi:hypothetical protein
MKIQPRIGTLLRALLLISAVSSIAVACGGTSVGNPNGSDGGPGGPSGNGDGGPFGGSSSGGSDATVRSDGSPGRDGSLGGGDGSITTFFDGTVPDGSGVICASGSCGCPAYETLCNGACIVTNLDPANCGSCRHACAANEACSAGVCSAGCTTPTNGGTVQIIKCGQLCVDRWNDNKNCGACGTDCTATGQVCIGGTCGGSAVALDGGSKSCPGGGPLIDITNGSIKTCVGTLAQTTFRWGLCTCGNVQLVNSGQPWGPAHPGLDFPALYIDAYDSSKGPWDPNAPEVGGSLGVNGTFNSVGVAGNNAAGTFTFLTGHWWNSSTIDTGGRTDVKQELHAGAVINAATGYDFFVGEPNSASTLVPVVPGTTSWDGYAASTINGPLTFFKDLYLLPGGGPGGATVKGTVKTASFSVPPPCDSCGARQIAVGTIVDQYAAPASNDNAIIGLNPSSMMNLSGNNRLDLPCGYYYLNGISSSGNVTVYAHGHTALFIGGDVSGFVVTFSVDPGGTFDVFVKGTVITTSDFAVGNPNYAALTRIYIGSPGIQLHGEAHFAGLVYMAGSNIDLTSHITAYGALYCNNFVGNGDNTDIHYDRAALRQGYGCDIAPSGCTTCADCGNQACVNGACAACTSSAQCCPPLTCTGGTCQ